VSFVVQQLVHASLTHANFLSTANTTTRQIRQLPRAIKSGESKMLKNKKRKRNNSIKQNIISL
jgi:hypothetical protein